MASQYGGGGAAMFRAPLVAGTALIRIFPRATVDEVLLSMQFGADPVVGQNPKGQVGTLGSGRLNVKKALDMAATLVNKTPLSGSASSPFRKIRGRSPPFFGEIRRNAARLDNYAGFA